MNRRRFLQRTATCAFGLLPEVRGTGVGAYLGRVDSIDVFSENGRIQSVQSRRPISLTAHPSGAFLFAANDIEDYLGLPTASVEAYAISNGGRLALINRQPLSLSAIHPRQLAVSPDGHYLLVAIYGGGAYNVVPVLDNGRLGGVTQIIKEIGRGPDMGRQACAHPHSLAFHPSGRFVFATDLGSDLISVFRFEDGKLRIHQRLAVPPGSGAGHLVVSEDGSSLSVLCALQPLRSIYRFNPRSGTLTRSINS